MNAHRHRSARAYCGSLIAIAALAVVGLWVLGAPGGPPANDAPPAKDAPTLGGSVVLQDDALEIGPIEGLTTAWHRAPEGTSIPVGLNLRFRTKATPTDTVTWTGAIEISRNDTWSTAICFLASPGDELVRAVVSSAQESYADEIRFNVVDIPLEGITVSPISVGPDPMEIDESLPPEELNEITMAYYFGNSIAAISPVGEGLYRTSINRLIPLQVTVMPQGFGPLIEWRVDGNAAKLGVSVEQALDETGLHTISAGPPAGEQTVDVETYEVIITSHVSGENIIPEGEPVLFTAVTDPPGYEDDITWLSSTLYGTASPVLGEGPVFIAEFNDTWGPHPDGGLWQWLGAKADNVAFGQDQKLGICCLIPDPCQGPVTSNECMELGGTFLVGEEFCVEELCQEVAETRCLYNVTVLVVSTCSEGADAVPADGALQVGTKWISTQTVVECEGDDDCDDPIHRCFDASNRCATFTLIGCQFTNVTREIPGTLTDACP